MMPDYNGGLRAIHERDMKCMESMVQEGIAVAVPAALQYCFEHKCPVQEWLLAASVELLCNLLRAEKGKRRGRAGTHIARYRQDGIDFSRWSTVHWQRESQKDLVRQVEEVRAYKDERYNDLRRDREQLQEWLGTSLSRAFECSAMLLEGTEAFGSPEAIKRSYFKVERNMADPARAIRYYQLDPHFLMKLGIKWEPFVRPGRKLTPLYELSL